MSEKNRDDKNRWRNVTIAFRMSPEENEELNNRVKLSGFRTKQDYIIQSVLHQKVVATGNPLMLVQFRGSSAIIRFVHFSYISILPLVTAYHNDHTLFFLSFLICC